MIPREGPYLVNFDFFKNIDGETYSYVTIGGFNSTWTYGGSLGSLKYLTIPKELQDWTVYLQEIKVDGNSVD